MSDAARGILALVGACVIWGLSPIFYKALSHVPAAQLVSHRMVWSLVFFTLIQLLRGRLAELPRAWRHGPTLRRLLVAALLVGTNWSLYIYAILIGETTQASLGYYIFPLVAVALGLVMLRESLSRMQVAAVVLAAAGVLVLAVSLGSPPWIALVLAVTFGLYGLIKKRLVVGPITSVTFEVGLFALPALIWIALQEAQGIGALQASPVDAGLLVLSGPVTGLPMVLFVYGAQRVSLGTTGLVFYLNPTLQLFCAVMIFGEPFGPAQAVTFGLIWTALALYSISSISREKARRRASITSEADPAEAISPDSEASAKPRATT